MNPSSILQFCYLLEAQLTFDLDKALENQVSGRILKKDEKQPLPWNTQEEDQNQLNLSLPVQEEASLGRYEYQVYIGPFSTSKILSFWQNKLSFTSEAFSDLASEDNHLSCYGTFRISGDGNLIKDSLELSGTPLFLGQVQRSSPQAIAQSWNFSSELAEYNRSVKLYFESQAKQLQVSGQPVTGKILSDVANHIVAGYSNWQPDNFRELGYWVRLGRNEKLSQKMFDSFLIKDIERIGESISQGEDVGQALASYLNSSVPKRIDLDQKANQQAVLSPTNLPLGRWPTNPDHHLSLQQQCAVNLIASELSESGLFSVNGPPGTGKTTMLRDVIAHIVTQRAIQMVAFDDPSSAFIEPKVIGGEVPATSPYRVDQRITGYEVVVVAANNGAVENISKEIPNEATIAQEYRASADYFKGAARDVLQENAWGLLAAVLGNKENRLNFATAFWNESSDYSFQSVLEGPPKLDWNAERQTFFELKSRVTALVSQRQDYKKAVEQYQEARQKQMVAEQQLADIQQRLSRLQKNQRHFRSRLEGIQAQALQQEAVVETALAQKPSIGLRVLSFFRAQPKVTAYRERIEQARLALNGSRSQETEELSRLDELKSEVRQTEGELEEVTHLATRARQHFAAVDMKCAEGRKYLGEAFADEGWWNRSEATVQMSVPWIDRELDDARSQLFLAALRVHQSFIEQSAGKIRKNLRLWVEMLKAGWPSSQNRKHALALWQSIFLVIPVVSTTFASIGSLFKCLDKEMLGWLLIDEAGQAVPQAAIGAMWRAKRVVAVGDPLQLEPVFTFQAAVVEGLRQYFQLTDCWNPHSYSVQGLADRVNPFGTELKQLGEPLWVGCPLRVHRRCIEPMFSIANAIAYDSKMVLATLGSRDDRFPAGPSQWVHVDGRCKGKHWVAEQGEEVLYLLAQMVAHSPEMPEVFVITPFKEISAELKKFLKKEYRQWASEQLSPSDINKWLRDSVGTVHTFQGKEADVVIFVLGLDREKMGAAQWASQKANLLNVAVTRARYRLYVIGDKVLWGDLQYFKTALLSLSDRSY